MILIELEKQAISLFAVGDVENYYKALRMYFQKLCTLTKFDREKYLNRFNEIRGILYSADMNQDGYIDELEKFEHNTILGKCMEDLEELYYELAEIKVDSGFSVRPRELADQRKKTQQRKQKVNLPIFDK